MRKYYDLNNEKKIAFFIGVSEKSITYLRNEHQVELARNAIECCWEWFINRKYDGEFLYELLDNEENGITIISDMVDDAAESAIWNCLIDTVAFVSRQAYDEEGNKYYPEPISLVDDNLAEHLLKCYYTVFPYCEFIDMLLDFLLSVDTYNFLEWKNRISKAIPHKDCAADTPANFSAD